MTFGGDTRSVHKRNSGLLTLSPVLLLSLQGPQLLPTHLANNKKKTHYNWPGGAVSRLDLPVLCSVWHTIQRKAQMMALRVTWGTLNI